MKNVQRHDNLRHCAAAVLLAAISSAAMAVNDEPLTEKWAPSVWGPDDLIGSVNWTTPETVMKGFKLVKQGKVATLGKVYQQDAPAFGSRGWRLTSPGLPTGGPCGGQELVYTGHGDIWHPSKWDSYDAAEKARRVAAFNAGRWRSTDRFQVALKKEAPSRRLF